MVAYNFKVHETVNTVYGFGFIESIREDCYVVRLANWALAQGQSPTLYLQADSMRPVSGAFPGTMVSTVYGPGRIEKIRADGVHVVKPINWKLANDKPATLYLQPEAVTLTHTAGFTAGDEVMTVYGQGFIEKIRGADLVVRLHNWKLAQGQSPTLYLASNSCMKVHGVKIGAIVKTIWGLVKVLDVRRDGTHVCEAVHWHLADGKPPKMYLAPEAFALLSIKP